MPPRSIWLRVSDNNVILSVRPLETSIINKKRPLMLQRPLFVVSSELLRSSYLIEIPVFAASSVKY